MIPGAQSCLWSMPGFLAAGFSADDLLPVSVNLTAANKTRIEITGAVVLRLRASSSANDRQYCAAMVYVTTNDIGNAVNRSLIAEDRVRYS